MKINILVVEDDPTWSGLVKEILEKRDFHVLIADNADAALQKIQPVLPALIIIDVNLKGISGFKLCEMLRAEPSTTAIPILMLTALKDVKDKVRGLESGADDYLPKPFSHEELAARVKALLRRASTVAAAAQETQLEAKDLSIDVERHEVNIKGKLVSLRPKEFDLLVLFMKNKGRVLQRQFLAQAVWGEDPIVTSQTIAQHVKNLRAKLGPCAEYIETVETLGYKFNDGKRS